jgi:hypothetical protein
MGPSVVLSVTDTTTGRGRSALRLARPGGHRRQSNGKLKLETRPRQALPKPPARFPYDVAVARHDPETNLRVPPGQPEGAVPVRSKYYTTLVCSLGTYQVRGSEVMNQQHPPAEIIKCRLAYQ